MGVIDTRAQKAVRKKTSVDKEEIIQEIVNYGTRYTEEMQIYGPDYKPSKYMGANKLDEILV